MEYKFHDRRLFFIISFLIYFLFGPPLILLTLGEYLTHDSPSRKVF